jgi:hypothetical protein
MLLVATAGALGSFIRTLSTIAQQFATRSLGSSWIWRYFGRIPIDAGLALLCYCVVRAAVAPSLANNQPLNSFGICSFGILTGLFGPPIIGKLREFGDDFFRTAPGKGDDERRDAPTRPVPAIFKIEPAELELSNEAVWIILRGASFIPGIVALVNDRSSQTVCLDESELRFLLEPTVTAGALSIRTELPPPDKTRSNTIRLRVKDVK